MRSFRTEGIIIKRRNSSEADRLITMFTKKHGKLQLIAKGVRKITSRRLGHVEMLNYSVITAYETKSYPILIEASTINDFSDIKKDLSTVGLSYHLCELIDGLCPEGVIYEEVFDIFKNTLLEISNSADYVPIIHSFEFKLLSILGFWHKDISQGGIVDTGSFIETIMERRLKSKSIFLKLN